MGNIIRQTTELALHLVRPYVTPDAVVIDATCGNGHDTLALAEMGPHSSMHLTSRSKPSAPPPNFCNVTATAKASQTAGSPSAAERMNRWARSCPAVIAPAPRLCALSSSTWGIFQVVTKNELPMWIPHWRQWALPWNSSRRTASSASLCTAATPKANGRRPRCWSSLQSWMPANGTPLTSACPIRSTIRPRSCFLRGNSNSIILPRHCPNSSRALMNPPTIASGTFSSTSPIVFFICFIPPNMSLNSVFSNSIFCSDCTTAAPARTAKSASHTAKSAHPEKNGSAFALPKKILSDICL